MTDTPGTLERLRAAIEAINPNSTDAEWSRLLAEAMNAADEIASLRARVEVMQAALTEIAHETRQALKDTPDAE